MDTYKETLEYLYSQLPMYQREGAPALKYDLSRITEIVKRLGNPHNDFPSVHIAGTNGKGSVSHMLAAILQAAGYKVGLHTSPHYVDFRERIKINGKLIPKNQVISFVQNVQPLLNEIRPSFFEYSVAMAFQTFKKEKVDIAIIEAGLGGRLDSTNVLRPVLSIITNIGFDHQEFLGNTLPKIAYEKAGIIKSNTPVVIGESSSVLSALFNRIANERNAPIYYAEQHVHIEELVSSDEGRALFKISKKNEVIFDKLELDGGGPFQLNNLRTVLQSIDILSEVWDISFDSIQSGLKDLRKLTAYIGRWTWISKSPKILADSGHNEAGLTYTSKWLNDQTGPLHIVLGMVKGKQPQELLKDFPAKATYYFCAPDVPRGMDPNDLMNSCREIGLTGNLYHSVHAAMQAAKSGMQKEAIMFVGGSSFVVAEALLWKN